jgi:hypothetical protein
LILVFLTVIFLVQNNNVETARAGHLDATDVELGLLHGASPMPITNDDESVYEIPPTPAISAAGHRHNLLEVIDALVWFSRSLRAGD